MSLELIEKLQQNKKSLGIYLIRRLDSNPKGQAHSYCVTLMKKPGHSLERAAETFNAVLRECIPAGSSVEYKNRMIVVRMDEVVCYLCIEAYKKHAHAGICVEDGSVKLYLLHRLGVEQAVYRLKKYRYQSWHQKRNHFSFKDSLDKIKKGMLNAELLDRYPNHADRFIASYKKFKENVRLNSSYIKGIL